MIINYKISNFRSIREEIEVDFIASLKYKEDSSLSNNYYSLNNINLLNSLIIYGRNAAGKSNILAGLSYIKQLVFTSDQFKHGDIIPYYEPYLFEEGLEQQPTTIEITFIGENQIKYNYKINFNSKKILRETLNFYPNNIIARLFERDENKIFYGEYLKGDKKIIEDSLLENQLFLSKSARHNLIYLKEAYLFFHKYLYISMSNDTDYDDSLVYLFTRELKENDFYKKNLMNFLSASDISIIDYELEKNEIANFRASEKIPNQDRRAEYDGNKQNIKMNHPLFNKGKIIGKKGLPIRSESVGTKKLLAVGGLILKALKTGSIIVIDELDKSLHPLLVRMIIKLFHSEKNNPFHAQLFFATHDSSLLDNTLFRRDQICIVEKGYEGNTEFFKVSDFKGIRKNIPLDKWYLSGRFKGVPIIDDIDLNF